MYHTCFSVLYTFSFAVKSLSYGSPTSWTSVYSSTSFTMNILFVCDPRYTKRCWMVTGRYRLSNYYLDRVRCLESSAGADEEKIRRTTVISSFLRKLSNTNSRDASKVLQSRIIRANSIIALFSLTLRLY